MKYVTSWERIAKEEGIEIGKEEGIEIGKEEGEKKGKLETAVAMVKKGLNLDLIAEVTGFSKQRVQQLAADSNSPGI